MANVFSLNRFYQKGEIMNPEYTKKLIELAKEIHILVTTPIVTKEKDAEKDYTTHERKIIFKLMYLLGYIQALEVPSYDNHDRNKR